VKLASEWKVAARSRLKALEPLRYHEQFTKSRNSPLYG